MHTRTARVIAWLTLGIALLVTTVGLWLVVVNFRRRFPGVSSVLSDAALILAFLPYAVVGALIVSRQPANRIGWLFLVSGLLMGVGLTAFEYAIYGDLTNPGSLPGTSWALRTSQWVSFIPFLTYAFLFLLFPDGRLPSRRWRPGSPLLAVLSIGWLEESHRSGCDPAVAGEGADRGRHAALRLGTGRPVSAVGERRAPSDQMVRLRGSAGGRHVAPPGL